MSLADNIVSDIRAKWPKIEPAKLDEVKAIVEARVSELDPEPPKTKRTVKRNILLDALVEACGGDPMKTTPMAFRSAGTALADIKSVEPGLSPEELFKRARRYRNKFPAVSLTPTALCKWWGDLGDGGERRHTTAEVHRLHATPPAGWWDWLCQNMPDEEDRAFGQLTVAKNLRNWNYMPESWKLKCRQSCGAAQQIGEFV